MVFDKKRRTVKYNKLQRVRKRKAEWQKQHSEEHKASCIKYRKTHPEKVRLSNAKDREKHHSRIVANRDYSKHNIYCTKWKKNNPKKRHAENVANRLKIPMVECCKCGSKKNLQRHHQDYDKPLEVIVVCPPCHKSEDRWRAACELWDEIGI